MSTDTAVLEAQSHPAPVTRLGHEATRDLHVKGVPQAVWCRARCNATLSGMAFKAYIIKLLEECTPYPGQENSPGPT